MIELDLFESDIVGESAAALTQRSLVDTQQRLGAMLEVMPIGILIHTQQGILFANREACRLLREDKDRLLGQHFLDFVHADDQAASAAQFRDAFLIDANAAGRESVLQRKDGSELAVKLVSCVLPWDGNPVIQILLQDITDQKRAESSLRTMTITDELTGAFNRRHLFYEAGLHIEGANLRQTPLSVLLVDIDHFKLVNDTHGHAVGDVALKTISEIAQRLVTTSPLAKSAMWARLGGEEFVLLLPGLAADDAMRMAERLRAAIAGHASQLETSTLKLTVSIGVAVYRPGDALFDTTLSRADSALYEAKKTGRNRVCLAP